MFVKICGVTNAEDALLAAGLGASAVGMIFAASQRRISNGAAIEIVRRLPPEVLSVGVFRNESKERVVETANRVGLRAVQLHGSESPADTRWISERVPNVIRAISVDDLSRYELDDFRPARLLIDSPAPGSGKTFEWDKLDALADRYRFILAGGLDPENVRGAVERVRPWGVDVATGVERQPGEKDPTKVMRFIGAARSAEIGQSELHSGESDGMADRASSSLTDPMAD